MADTATGVLVRYIPEGPELDELLGLVRIGLKFQPQQKIGRRLDFCTRYIIDLARTIKQPVTFAALLDELETEAARREIHGEKASPIERVDRVWQLVTLHHPRRGSVQTPFKTLQNKLTIARKIIVAEQIPVAAIPG